MTYPQRDHLCGVFFMTFIAASLISGCGSGSSAFAASSQRPSASAQAAQDKCDAAISRYTVLGFEKAGYRISCLDQNRFRFESADGSTFEGIVSDAGWPLRGEVVGNNRRFSGTFKPVSGYERVLYGYDEGDLTEYKDGSIYATSSGKFKSNELRGDKQKAILSEGVYRRFSKIKQNEKWGNIVFKQTGEFLQKNCAQEPKISKGVIEYADGRVVEGTFSWGVPYNVKETRQNGSVTITQADLRFDPRRSCTSKIPDKAKWILRDVLPASGAFRSVEVTFFPEGSDKLKIGQGLEQVVINFLEDDLLGPVKVARTGQHYCADEGNMCEIDGEALVLYGAKDRYASKLMSGAFLCNNETFGDPIFGVRKKCFYTPADEPLRELELRSGEYIPLADLAADQIPALRISNIAALDPDKRYYQVGSDDKASKQSGWLSIEHLASTEWANGQIVGARTNFAHEWSGPLDDKGRPHGVGKQPLFRAVADEPARNGYFWSHPRPIDGKFEEVEYVHGKARTETSYARASAEAQRHNDKIHDVLTAQHRQELQNREMAFLAEQRAEEAEKRRQYEDRKRRRAQENEERRQRKAENFAALQDHIVNNPSTKRINEVSGTVTPSKPPARQAASGQADAEPGTRQTSTIPQRQGSRSENSGSAVQSSESTAVQSIGTARSSQSETKVASAPEVYMRNGRAVPIHECARLVEVRTGRFALGTGLHEGWEDLTDRKVFLENVCDKPITVGACFVFSNNENSKDSRVIQSGTTRSLDAIARVDRTKGADGRDVISNGRQPVAHELFVWGKGGAPAGFRTCS